MCITRVMSVYNQLADYIRTLGANALFFRPPHYRSFIFTQLEEFFEEAL